MTGEGNINGNIDSSSLLTVEKQKMYLLFNFSELLGLLQVHNKNSEREAFPSMQCKKKKERKCRHKEHVCHFLLQSDTFPMVRLLGLGGCIQTAKKPVSN